MFAPGEAELWREAGLLNAHLGNLRAALMGLDQFLEPSSNQQARHEVATLLRSLKTRLN